MKKMLASALLVMALSFQSLVVFANDTDVVLTAEEYKALQDGAFLNSVADYIVENFAGGEVTKDQIIKNAIKGMTKPLDKYSNFMFGDEATDFMSMMNGSAYGIGITLTLDADGKTILEQVEPNSPAQKAGLLIGDVVVSINGKKTEGLQLYQVANLIADKGDKYETVKIGVARDGLTKEFTMKVEDYKTTTVYTKKLSDLIGTDKKYDDTIGYIKIMSFMEPTGDEFDAAVQGLQKQNIHDLILDLRDNPGGDVEVSTHISQSLVKEGVLFTTVSKSGEMDIAKSELKTPIFEHIVVLVNENSASASELLASAIKDSGSGILVGRTTFGKGVMQEVLELNGGGLLKLTTHENFSRNGSKINGVGVVPNVAVTLPAFLDYAQYNDGDAVAILKILGYDASTKEKETEALKKIQKEHQLDVTGELNGATAYAINVLYAKNQSLDDKILKEGLKQMLKYTE